MNKEVENILNKALSKVDPMDSKQKFLITTEAFEYGMSAAIRKAFEAFKEYRKENGLPDSVELSNFIDQFLKEYENEN